MPDLALGDGDGGFPEVCLTKRGIDVARRWAALRGHILGGLAGATYMVALDSHISGGPAGATYRVPLGGHIPDGLAVR